MAFTSLKDIDFTNKTALVRLDLNVPLDGTTVTDATRIERVIPTLKALQESGAKIIIMAHLGRPKGQAREEFSLAPVAEALSQHLGSPVAFAADTVGSDAQAKKAALNSGDVLLLENLRFNAQEEANDMAFAKQLAEGVDVYVNDAFSCAHRAHASTEAITHVLPAVAGLLMEEELNALEAALTTPQRPVMAIVGGAKVSSKVDLLQNLIEKVDMLAIGGGMANTFLLAQGHDIANSFCDRESAPVAQSIMEKAAANNCEIILPADTTVAEKLEEGIATQTCAPDAITEGTMILDVGPEGIEALKQKLEAAQTLVWNGPLGVFETKPFDTGTNAVALYAAELTKQGTLTSVAGGGDTVAALNQSGAASDFSYLSTAGGAFLEWLEGKTLPGVAALEAAHSKAA